MARCSEMRKIRTLIVDDAVIVRKILTDTLQADPEIEVVGSASNGRLALMKVSQLKPDIITLDQEMPELSGTETLKILRKEFPEIPVIMFSAFTERGAALTLEALNLGASDYVTKPSNFDRGGTTKEEIYSELRSKIKVLGRKEEASGRPPYSSVPKAALTEKIAVEPKKCPLAPMGQGPIDVLTIGVSTGGPNALAKVLPALPADLSVPVVVVQHMPPMFTRLLAERLDAQCALSVVEATEGMKVEAGTIYIAPGDYHLELVRSGADILTHLHQGPQENSCRPAVDVLFRSCVNVYGPRVLAAVLTGMGSDGFIGCQQIRQAGGRVLAQDEASSVVWGMPAYVAEGGLAEAIVPLDEIASELTRRITQGNIKRVSRPERPSGGTQ